jgi:F-type H+-transporting ATPase subunit gamma
MKGIKIIQKITKTMKMIANARLKSAEDRVYETRPFYNSAVKALSDTVKVTVGPKHRALVIPITSDRGLCGSVNSSVVRDARERIKTLEKEGAEISIVSVGMKGTAQLNRTHSPYLLFEISDLGRKPMTWTGISAITERIITRPFDSVTIVYNYFNNIVSFTTTAKRLVGYAQLQDKPETAFDEYEFEDEETNAHLEDLYEMSLASTIYSALVESQAAELGARMSSMDGATRNATSLLKKLNTQYNRARQAAITTELIEIISGAAAISDAK